MWAWQQLKLEMQTVMKQSNSFIIVDEFTNELNYRRETIQKLRARQQNDYEMMLSARSSQRQQHQFRDASSQYYDRWNQDKQYSQSRLNQYQIKFYQNSSMTSLINQNSQRMQASSQFKRQKTLSASSQQLILSAFSRQLIITTDSNDSINEQTSKNFYRQRDNARDEYRENEQNRFENRDQNESRNN